MTDNLGLTQMAVAQSNKETTHNDSNGELDAALTAPLVSDYTSGDVTLTTLQYQRNISFRTSNLTVARTLNLPTTTARAVIIDNSDGTAALTVAQGGSTVEVPAGVATWISTDGTAGDLRDLNNAPVEDFIFFPVEGHINPTAAGGSAALATVATAANQPDVTSLDFDQTTAEHAQLRYVFEKAALLGNVSFQFLWSHSGGANFGTTWNAKGVSVSNDDLLAQNFGAARKIVDVGGTTNDHYLTDRTGFVKVATPADNDLVIFDLFRDPVDAGDDLTADARLQGVLMHFWRNQPLDPDWASVSLMAGFDGEDGATDQDDESDNGFTITYGANAQVDTAQSKFSRGSLLLDGTGDYASVPDNAVFDFGSGDFTIEGWYRWNADPAIFQLMQGHWLSSASQKSVAIFYDGSANNMELFLSTDGSASLIDLSGAFTPTLNQWYHIAADFDGTTYRLYIDGVVIDTSTTLRTLHNSTAAYSLGGQTDGTNPFDGWIAQARATKGVARYAGAFIPPTAPFPRA